MTKHFYMQFDVGDWMKDHAVGSCTPATRGVWMDLLCAMHEAGRTGELSKTHDQLMRIARCSAADLTHALTDLQATGAAEVTIRNGTVTLINRRMRREWEVREAARLRKQRNRDGVAVSRECHGHVTPHIPEPEPKPKPLNSQSPERSKPTTGPPSVTNSGGSGRLKKPFEGDLDEATLRDEARFAKWVARERRQRHGLIKSDDAERLAWAAREKALADKTLESPLGWLKDTIRHGAWDRVRQSHESSGRDAEREAASDGGAALIAAGVAPALRDVPVDPAIADQRLRLRHQAVALAKLEKERA